MNNYCTFYIVRHGQTDWNAKGLLQGHSGSDLTQEGKSQAKNTAEELKHISFVAVYSSDLLRAKQTAEIIALERKLEVVTTQLLRERSFGPFEGKPYETMRKFDGILDKLTAKERFSYKIHPQVESDEELIRRFTTFLREIAIRYEGKNILLVTHAGIMRSFLIYTGFETHESLSYKTAKIANSAYIELKSDGVDFEVVKTVGIEKAKIDKNP